MMEADLKTEACGLRLDINEALANKSGGWLVPAIDAVILEYLQKAASQAREQALLEALETIKDIPNIHSNPDIASGYGGGTYDAWTAVVALTTPEAQAQVQRRIVAGWLEEKLGAASERYNEHPNERDDRRVISATNLLAALKEQE